MIRWRLHRSPSLCLPVSRTQVLIHGSYSLEKRLVNYTGTREIAANRSMVTSLFSFFIIQWLFHHVLFYPQHAVSDTLCVYLFDTLLGSLFGFLVVPFWFSLWFSFEFSSLCFYFPLASRAHSAFASLFTHSPFILTLASWLGRARLIKNGLQYIHVNSKLNSQRPKVDCWWETHFLWK